jgi:hypothetical protein
LVVPQLGAQRLHGRDVDEGVNVEKLHGFWCCQSVVEMNKRVMLSEA